VAPKVSLQAHDKELWAICLAPGPEDPERTGARIFTACELREHGKVGGCYLGI
jgi:hypothetical protein